MTTIRQLVPADLPAFRVIRLQALRRHPEAFSSSYEEESVYQLADFSRFIPTEPPNVGFGAFAGDALVGMASLRVESRLKTHHKGTLIGVYVEPAHRRGGTARALVTAVLDSARAAGLDGLRLSVTEGNANAEALYASLGFRRYGVEPRALMIGDVPYNDVLMALTFAPR